VVAPQGQDQYAAESARTFNEAYSLAFAQQLKNKDIPEGGAKAVVLMEPHPSDTFEPDQFGHNFMVRKCVRAFTDGLLDLTIPDPRVVDYFKQDEILYLGPDENIIPQDIEWIIQQGIKRNYSLPQSLMSSKPNNGINHKKYGVTSLGVAENLEVALVHLGAHPSVTQKPFTVKLTGGTDGDVGGNMIKQLAQRYGTNVKVVGMADGTACLEDPAGLNMEELVRMVDASEPLSHFDVSLLGPEGNLAKTDTVQGTLLRDTMHNRVAADAFVPCGGRPGTINVRNFKEYLSGPNGAASSKVIVEGANLFITPEARQALFDEAQVVVVKDSSANKCGVVTSSYEILASMLVSPEEFVEMKERLVADVMVQLQRLARCVSSCDWSVR
jgi:glutamate dehydrogenase